MFKNNHLSNESWMQAIFLGPKCKNISLISTFFAYEIYVHTEVYSHKK